MCECVGVCMCVGGACACACVCVCVHVCVHVHVCGCMWVCMCALQGLEAGRRVHLQYQISTRPNWSLRGTKIERPKTPKMNTEHEAGSTQG